MYRLLDGPMPRFSLGLLPLLLAACASPAPRAVPASGPRATELSGPRLAALSPARFFQGLPEESFWVTHDEALDRVIVGGARLEVSASSEIVAAAWDADVAVRGDALVGAV